MSNQIFVAASEVRVGDILVIDDYTRRQVARIDMFICGDGEPAYQYHVVNGGTLWNRASDSVIVSRAIN